MDAVIERLGGRIRVALPLGLGKPARFVDALYRRVRSSPELSLEIHTALPLEVPRARSDQCATGHSHGWDDECKGLDHSI